MSKLHGDLIDYVKNCRVAMTQFEIAFDLETLGKHGGAWPRASANEWKRTIENAIADGDLIELDGAVRLSLEVDKKPEQLSLF